MTTYSGQQFASPEEALAHFGVKGMHWGVRKGDHPGASRKTNKQAANDAAEYARAKMFYGEGAGTRRKLIKATVEAKAKKDPTYKAAFEHHLAKQDLGQHASKARSERRRKDATKATTKTVKGAHRSLTGQMGNVTLAAALLAGGYTVARKNGADEYIRNVAKDSYKKHQNHKAAEAFLKDMGMR